MAGMTKLMSFGVATLALPLLIITSVVVLAANGAALIAPALTPQTAASEEALADIPPELLALYQQAAQACDGLSWQILAGIAKVESNHGRHGRATIDPDGRIRPPIIGIPLDGTNGTAAIPDTDNGRFDGDPVWDRAVGPFQFIPTSWAIFGVDGNGDAIADPNNIYDAVPAAVAHLCPTGTVTDIETAIFTYNHSTSYVDLVLEWADTYSAPEGVVSAGDYAYPLPHTYATDTLASRTHHDYPAWDAAIPTGTPLYAMVAGTVTTAHDTAGIYPNDPNRCGNTVTIAGIDGATYTYCHLTALTVTVDQTVTPGTPLGASGGVPGTPGAGNTTGPHLHLGVRYAGRSVCPQQLLVGIIHGAPIAPSTLPATGCTH